MKFFSLLFIFLSFFFSSNRINVSYYVNYWNLEWCLYFEHLCALFDLDSH